MYIIFLCLSSYPFSEDVGDGISYMKTRCPAWCDRILLTQDFKDLIASTCEPEYRPIGQTTCMGDHKVVYPLLLYPLNLFLQSNLSPSYSANSFGSIWVRYTYFFSKLIVLLSVIQHFYGYFHIFKA